jgi:invasion protein IalB
MLKLIYAVSAIGLAAAASVPAVAQAQTSAPAAGQQTPPGPNPNEVICQKQEVIGSRLASKRICKTRAEWADAQLQDKQELNRVQTQRGNAGNGP